MGGLSESDTKDLTEKVADRLSHTKILKNLHIQKI